MTADNWYVVGVKCSYGQLGEHYIFTVITSKDAHNFTISLIKILIIVYNMQSTYVHVHVQVVCGHAYICVCMYVCVYVSVCVCVYMCVCVCVYMCVCVHAYVCAHV